MQHTDGVDCMSVCNCACEWKIVFSGEKFLNTWDRMPHRIHWEYMYTFSYPGSGALFSRCGLIHRSRHYHRLKQGHVKCHQPIGTGKLSQVFQNNYKLHLLHLDFQDRIIHYCHILIGSEWTIIQAGASAWRMTSVVRVVCGCCVCGHGGTVHVMYNTF